MGNKRRYTLFEILNVIYFLSTLFVLACKFGLFFKLGLREKIFNIYNYFISTTMLVISIIMVIVYLEKSKKIRNDYEINNCSKNVISLINIGVISFEFLFLSFRIYSIKNIAFEWLQLTIYLSIIKVIIYSLVYFFVRDRIVNDLSYFNQRDIINNYIIYAIAISIILGIIIPNFLLHFGIIKAIRERI